MGEEVHQRHVQAHIGRGYTDQRHSSGEIAGVDVEEAFHKMHEGKVLRSVVVLLVAPIERVV